jgi:hypothetical protein
MELLQFAFYSCLLAIFPISLYIHGVIVSLAGAAHVQVLTMYLILYFGLGVLGIFIYRFGAGGPAHPWGQEKVERDMFWLILLTGLFGCILSLIAAIDNLFFNMKVMASKRKKVVSQDNQPTTNNPSLNEEEVRELRNLM